MTTSRNSEPRAEKVTVSHDSLTVYLVDGRKLEVPLVWFPRLCKATASQRKKYELLGHGLGIHWPEIDEDISIEGLLNTSAYPLSFQNEKGKNLDTWAAESKSPKYGKKKGKVC